ncbi:unnamed protein product [Dovyalis caffra]|uniref:Uncharacterized protein n=1 Tax=Dovyalis caffra TaxID=77055 RepID=A0AAV1RKJ4_9ROSI|nr:unnamed protein product [Dovyalis caffra]
MKDEDELVMRSQVQRTGEKEMLQTRAMEGWIITCFWNHKRPHTRPKDALNHEIFLPFDHASSVITTFREMVQDFYSDLTASKSTEKSSIQRFFRPTKPHSKTHA